MQLFQFNFKLVIINYFIMQLIFIKYLVCPNVIIIISLT